MKIQDNEQPQINTKSTHHVINTTTGNAVFEGTYFQCRAKLDRLGALGMKALNESINDLITLA